MNRLPADILSQYRRATTREVHSRSYGALKAARHPNAQTWEQRRGTLEDQAIFGPVRNHECACGKYRGVKHAGIVCDCCGVKITTTDVRRERFAHIDLSMRVPYPLMMRPDEVEAFPILPASFFESVAGEPLAEAYDALVVCNASQDQDELAEALCGIVDLLVPVAVDAHNWRLQDAPTLARGLSLERRDDPFTTMVPQ